MALHWASISTLPFVKLAKMISVLLSPGKKKKKRKNGSILFHSSGGKWDPTCSSRRRGEGAGEIDRSRSGRQVGALGEGRAARGARSRGSVSGGEGGDDREGAEGVPQT